MNKNKGVGKKENEETQIPKPAGNKTAKGFVNKKTMVSTIPVQSSKEKQAHITCHPKNVKRMSIVKISKDVRDLLQTEDQKLDDQNTELTDRVPHLNKEITTKRVVLKKESSQTTQKNSGKIQKKPATMDLKKKTAYGGLKLIPKKTSRKCDFFGNLKTESEVNLQDKHPIEPGTEETQMGDSKPAKSKVLELSDQVKENVPPSELESSKETSKNLKEFQNNLKNAMAIGGIVFKPKWKSTPLRPDLFENVEEEIKLRDEKLFPSDLSSKGQEKTLFSKKVFTKEATELKVVTVDGTVQLGTKEMEYFTPPSLTGIQDGEKKYPAFGGLRMVPKRKSTCPKPDILVQQQRELKSEERELHPSAATTEQEKMSSVDTKADTKITEEHALGTGLDREFNQPSTSKSSQLTAYDGTRFAPQWKSTPIRADIQDRIQKESKINDLESYPAVTKELKKVPGCKRTVRKLGTAKSTAEKFKAPSTRKPECPKKGVKKNEKEDLFKPVPTFGGMRFKMRQKKLHDVLDTLKDPVGNQAQHEEKE